MRVNMAKLTEIDLSLIKRYASHPSGLGYVAEFSNQTFSTWFRDNWNIDIDDPKFEDSGTSKGNRLVSFCRQEDNQIVFKVLCNLRNVAHELSIEKSKNVTPRDVAAFDAMLDQLQVDQIAPEKSPEADNIVFKKLTKSELLSNAKKNEVSLVLMGALALENLSVFKETVRSDNHLAIAHSDLRDDLLKLLDALISHIETLLSIIPSKSESLSESDEDQIISWTQRYMNGAMPKLQEYFEPEKLGSSSIPVGVILTCGGLGSLLTGFSPIGFGAGSLVGKLIVGEMKSGAAADQITRRLENDE